MSCVSRNQAERPTVLGGRCSELAWLTPTVAHRDIRRVGDGAQQGVEADEAEHNGASQLNSSVRRTSWRGEGRGERDTRPESRPGGLVESAVPEATPDGVRRGLRL